MVKFKLKKRDLIAALRACNSQEVVMVVKDVESDAVIPAHTWVVVANDKMESNDSVIAYPL